MTFSMAGKKGIFTSDITISTWIKARRLTYFIIISICCILSIFIWLVVSCSYWINEVHGWASCSLLQQELYLWAPLQFTPRHPLLPTTSQQEQKLLPEEEFIIYCDGANDWDWGPEIECFEYSYFLPESDSWWQSVLSAVPLQLRLSIHWVWWILAVLTSRGAAKH